MIGYQTAYLKAHWPTEFIAALLTADQQNTDRIAVEIEECRNMGIEVLAPDVNESFADFTVVTKGTATNEVSDSQESKIIRFGLRAIKNVGAHITEVIIKKRKVEGPFKDIADFLQRIQDKDLNKKSYKRIQDIPENIDLCIIAVPAKYVIEIVNQAKEEINNLIIISAGFKEIGGIGRDDKKN